MTPAPTYAFGPYLFIPSRQLLLKDGRAMRVGGRALDLLAAFVNRPGQMLSKFDLLAEAWPSTTVVEGNLKVHIAALRRVLDDDAEAPWCIATINGRGYRFIAPVETGEALTALVAREKPAAIMGELRAATSARPAGGLSETMALLASAMRSSVIDLGQEASGETASVAPRRVLFIELTASNEAWIEDVFARQLRAISAMR